MRAAVVQAFGQPLVIEERPDPEPGKGELLVAVRAAGLNGADMLQRRGLYAAPPDAPADTPGLELAGEVVATGPEVARHAVGDHVMAAGGGGAGPAGAGAGWVWAGGRGGAASAALGRRALASVAGGWGAAVADGWSAAASRCGAGGHRVSWSCTSRA